MAESDSIKLLRECDAGIKMGVISIDEVLSYVKNPTFRKLLTECRNKHEKLREEIQMLLLASQDDGKDPNPIAKSMSWMKTNVKLVMDQSDETIADLMTDGCNMGVKTLHRYLNQYQGAEEKTKDIAKRLINLVDIRAYL